MDDMTKHQMGGLKCPGCGMALELNPVDHNSEADPSTDESGVTMEEAETMPFR